MPHTLTKTMGLALAGFLLMAPVGMAAGTSSEKSTGPGSPHTGTQMQQSTPSMPSGQADQRVSATVEDIDQAKGALTLRMEQGDRVELKLPKQALSGLKEGDRVQVAILKESGASGSQGTPSTPGRSPSGSSERPQSTR
jgi:Cu/Ag efflux protein CusF